MKTIVADKMQKQRKHFFKEREIERSDAQGTGKHSEHLDLKEPMKELRCV